VYAKKKEVYKAMMEENKDNMDESEEGSKAETDFVIGDAITDQHVECEIKVLESIKEILTDDGEKN
jgi:hypothetical protein